MLTCHGLYVAFSPTLKLDMGKPAKIRFLQLLEQQFPKHYLCHGCATYHPLLAKDEPRKYAKFLMRTNMSLLLQPLSYRHLYLTFCKDQMEFREGDGVDSAFLQEFGGWVFTGGSKMAGSS